MTGTGQPGRRGKLFLFFLPLTSYLVTNITVTLFWIYFFVFNHTTVIGRANVGYDRNTLLLANHQSMIDSFLVGLAAYLPQSWLKPHLLPWNPAAVENFYRSRLLAWLSDNWKCIPVQVGRRDMRALHRMTRLLPKGTMTIFPEGTRTRDGSIGEGQAGAGLIALATKARVIPVTIWGMNRALPIGKVVPRLFQRVVISYGPPVEYSDLQEQPRSKETAQILVDRAMEAIREMQAEIEAGARR